MASRNGFSLCGAHGIVVAVLEEEYGAAGIQNVVARGTVTTLCRALQIEDCHKSPLVLPW